MQRPVVRLKPRLRPIEDAIDAYRQARFDDALTALHGHETLDSSKLRVRALLRRGDVAEACREVDAVDIGEGSHSDRGELLTLRGAVLSRIDLTAARASLDEARAYVFGTAMPALEAELHYYDAFWSFAADDLEGATLAAQTALAVTRGVCDRPAPYFVSLESTRARAFDVLGTVQAARGRYDEQLRYARKALLAFDASPTVDVFQEAVLLRNLAALVRDFDLPDDASMLRERAGRIKWTPATQRFHYQITEALGWCNALRGNHVGAFRDFRIAMEMAPTLPLKVSALLAHAYLARELDHAYVAVEELQHAQELCAKIDWERVVEDECEVLLYVVQHVVHEDPLQARTFLNRYRSIKTRMAPQMAARLEMRVRANESLSEGMVASAEGHRSRAVGYLLDAFEGLDAIGYRWRAALVASELAKLTGEPRFLAYARKEATSRSASWLNHDPRNIGVKPAS